MKHLSLGVVVVGSLVILYASNGSFWDFNVLEVFAAVAIIVAALIGVKRVWDSVREPYRIYDMRFIDLTEPFPNAQETSIASQKNLELQVDSEIEIHVWIRLRKRVEIRNLDFSLIKREWFPSRPSPWPVWTWLKAASANQGVEVIRLWDAEREAEQRTGTNIMGTAARRPPLIRPDGSGGYSIQFVAMEHPAMERYKGESLWIRVIISAAKNWHGYLKIAGPGLGGRRAYVRRGVRTTIQCHPN